LGISVVFIIFMVPMIVFSLAGDPDAEGEETGEVMHPGGESTESPNATGANPEISGRSAVPDISAGPLQLLLANLSDSLRCDSEELFSYRAMLPCVSQWLP
jgi:hypothetical protein